MRDTECRMALSKKRNRLSEIAARDSKVKFTSLAYLLTKDFLRVCYREPNHQQATTVGHVSYATYCENLDYLLHSGIDKATAGEAIQDVRYTAGMDTKAGWEATAFRNSRSGKKNRLEMGGEDEVMCR
jgi:hypothetical protein